MPRSLLFTIATLVLIAAAPSGHRRAPTIIIGPNVQVSKARENNSHLEVAIAAHPTRPNWLLACSMLVPGGDAVLGTAAYASFDGGATWSAPELSGTYWADDPTCAYGSDSSAYFIHKANGRGRRSSDGDWLGIHRSTDGGRSWQPEIHGPQVNDRPFMAVGIDSMHRDRVYVAFNGHVHGVTQSHDNASFRNTVAMRSSDDGGRTFPWFAERALMDQTVDTLVSAAMAETKVLTDGTVLVLYGHGMMGGRNAATGKPRELRASLEVLRSIDGGESFGPAVRIADVRSGYNYAHTRGTAGSMAVDVSATRFRNRVYTVWADFTSGRGQILLSSSADAGLTWSTPKTVSDDLARPAGDAGPDNFMPAVTVNRDGVVGVMWYDRRDCPNNRDYYVRFAASADGGESWTRSERVSSAPNARAQESGGKGTSFSETGGDTSGLTASADGSFHPLWIDNRTGVQQVWTAVITVKP